MAEDSCKVIEKHIKDMIFNRSDSYSKDIDEHLIDSASLSENVVSKNKNCIVPGNEKFVSDIEAKLLPKSDISMKSTFYSNFSHVMCAAQTNFDHESFLQNKLLSDQTDNNDTFSSIQECVDINEEILLSSPKFHPIAHQLYNKQVLLSHDSSTNSEVNDGDYETERYAANSVLSHNVANEALHSVAALISAERDVASSSQSLLKSSNPRDSRRSPKKEKKGKRKKKLKGSILNDKSFNTEASSSLKSGTKGESNISSGKSELPDRFTNKDKEKSEVVSTKASAMLQEKKIRVNNCTLPLMKRESFISKIEGKIQANCFVCDFVSGDVAEIVKHYSTQNHSNRVKAKEKECLLQNLPEPLPAQVLSITMLLQDVADKYGLSELNVLCRRKAVEQLNEILKCHIPECSLQLVGSSGTGFGLKSSEVDIVLKVPKDKNAADMLFTIFEVLEQDSNFRSVRSEFRKKIPQINFVYTQFNLTCNICIDNGTISEVTNLLRCYFEFDDRVPILGFCFRQWAKICEIDQQDKGTLPAFCFPLMLIHFLQQVKPPVLPVFQEPSSNLKLVDVLKLKEKWCCRNTASTGELWIKLLRFYSVEYQCGKDVVCIRSLKKVSCEDKNWGTKILAIEDPIVHRNLAHVIPNRRVFQYIHDCFVKSYSYFGYPRTSAGPLMLNTGANSHVHVLEDNGKKSEINTMLLASTLEKGIGAPDSSLILSDFLEDTDPDLQFEDVLSTINNLALDEINSDVDDNENDVPDSLGKTTNSAFDESSLMSISSAFNHTTFPSPICTSSRTEVDVSNQVAKISPLESSEVGPMNAVIKQDFHWDLSGKEHFANEDMCYIFLDDNFKKDKFAPLVCSLCQKLGHVKKDCPDEILPDVLPLPHMTYDFKKVLDFVCEQIMKENQPTVEEQCQRDYDMRELQKYIREVFPEAVLEMFGSFCNGFGFSSSDMDLCLTFKDNPTGEDLESVTIINDLATRLRKNSKFASIIPITTAKVPIVKFVFRDSELEGDISLYNTLAQHNTRMLDAYCKIDRRVQVLGYTLKYFAKVLRIGDASRGSLSSYAYILMVLFFLQQREPPVIPVLQELYDGKKPLQIVDGWNAWFYGDLESLPRVWANYGKNTESVGELWLGLLKFYTEDFNTNEYVVCIRQKQLLTRFRKLWNSTSIAIEDPFDLNHNLGSGLSRRMNNYILKAFIRGRNLFGTPVSRFPMGVPEKEYLFDRHTLCDGQEPPNDRGCRYCGKIGHMVKDCPRKNQQKQNQNQNQRRMRPRNNRNVPMSLDPGSPQSGRPIPGSKKGYDKRENFVLNQGKHKNQRNLPRNVNERMNEPPPPAHRIEHLFSLQRFAPPPGFPPNSPQPGMMRHPAPFTIQPHSNAVHRPATSAPFPGGTNIPHLLMNSMKNSQNYAMVNAQHGRLPRPPDNMSHFEYSSPNNVTSEAVQHHNRGVPHQVSARHVSHHPSPGMMFPSGHPLNTQRDFHQRLDRW